MVLAMEDAASAAFGWAHHPGRPLHFMLVGGYATCMEIHGGNPQGQWLIPENYQYFSPTQQRENIKKFWKDKSGIELVAVQNTNSVWSGPVMDTLARNLSEKITLLTVGSWAANRGDVFLPNECWKSGQKEIVSSAVAKGMFNVDSQYRLAKVEGKKEVN